MISSRSSHHSAKDLTWRLCAKPSHPWPNAKMKQLGTPPWIAMDRHGVPATRKSPFCPKKMCSRQVRQVTLVTSRPQRPTEIARTTGPFSSLQFAQWAVHGCTVHRVVPNSQRMQFRSCIRLFFFLEVATDH